MLLEDGGKGTPHSSNESDPPVSTPRLRPRTNSDPSINTSQQPLNDLTVSYILKKFTFYVNF